MKVKSVLLIMLNFWILAGCEDHTVAVPEVNYYGPQIIATFNQPGKISPEINWNGEEGSVSLLDADPIFSVDPKSGILSWDRMVDPSESHDVAIGVSNSAGDIIINLRIINVFSGSFTAQRSSDIKSEVYINFDGYYNFYPNGLGEYSDDWLSWNTSWSLTEDGKIILYVEEVDWDGNLSNPVYEMEIKSNDSTGELWLEGLWYKDVENLTSGLNSGKVKMIYRLIAS